MRSRRAVRWCFSSSSASRARSSATASRSSSSLMLHVEPLEILHRVGVENQARCSRARARPRFPPESPARCRRAWRARGARLASLRRRARARSSPWTAVRGSRAPALRRPRRLPEFVGGLSGGVGAVEVCRARSRHRDHDDRRDQDERQRRRSRSSRRSSLAMIASSERSIAQAAPGSARNSSWRLGCSTWNSTTRPRWLPRARARAGEVERVDAQRTRLPRPRT